VQVWDGVGRARHGLEVCGCREGFLKSLRERGGFKFCVCGKGRKQPAQDGQDFHQTDKDTYLQHVLEHNIKTDRGKSLLYMTNQSGSQDRPLRYAV